ncbi:hypothetical protein [Ralstonia phage RSP15]|uniref:tRNA amidotransferase n=1 Tax=Ralstonia phage RSP15 TaxID=1785960 RepID=UPI00074D3DC2|nr:tRNA amidotransferase [Ralstonia phage RSP15]BAU40058.1 hypothetical protein [Ralstonia phage RSP15]
MALLDTIKADRMAAMKEGDKIAKDILTTLIGEVETKSKQGKELADADIVALVKKFIDNNDETLKLVKDDETKIETSNILIQENLVLGAYIPKQLSFDEIATILKHTGYMNLGHFMKYLKEHYAGQYDGKVAKQVFEKNA